MTAIIISASPGYTFGQMTGQMTSRLIGVASQIERLHEAIATASAGYDGEPGTQFEAPAGGGMGAPANLFGVVPGATPGAQGQAYRYAMDQLYEQWTTFWTAAKDYIEALDNGAVSM